MANPRLIVRHYPRFIEYARLNYGRPLIAGMGFRHCPSGFTVATLDSAAPGLTRLLICAALPKGFDSRLGNWRILAATTDGRTIAARDMSAASGTGSHSTAITFLCEFPASGTDIEEIIVQLKKDDPAVKLMRGLDMCGEAP
jgi:hypothetical protein